MAKEGAKKGDTVVSAPKLTTKRSSIPAYKRILDKMKVAGTITPFEESVVSKPKTWLTSEMLNLNWVLGHGVPFGCLWEVSGTESSSKAVPLSTPVLTPTGWKKMADIHTGDVVCDPTGGVQYVEDVTYRGVRPVYKISFNDGTYAYCDPEHLWRVQDSHQRWRVLSTQELIHKGIKQFSKANKYRGDSFQYKWKIPMVESLTFEPKELEVHPYLLGVMIGDGCMTTNVALFSNPFEDREIAEKVATLIPDEYELALNTYATCPRYVIKQKQAGAKQGYIRVFKKMGLDVYSGQKFIPQEYLWGSTEQRKELLAGLMDTDGTCTENGTASFSTSSEQLAKDVVYLVQSLGGMARVHFTERHKDASGRELCNMWQVSVHTPFNPFYLTRKAVRYRGCRGLSRYITSISRVDDAEVQCIRVSGATGVYVINDFIVTHNSSLVYALSASLQRSHEALVMVYDTESLDNGMAVRTGLVPEMTAIATPDAKASIPNIVNDMMEKIMLIEEDNEKGSYDADGPTPIIMVWDSIAATPTQTIKQAMANKRDGVKVGIVAEQMSATAAQLTSALKTLHPAIVNNNILAMFINQMRDTINQMPTWGGPTEHTSGGRALKHAANIRLKTKYENMHKTFNESGKRDIMEGNQRLGITFTVEAIKNKLAAPFKKTEFVNMFGTGIDIVQSNLLHAMYDLMEAQIIPLPVGGYFRLQVGGVEKKYRYGQVLDYYRNDPIAYQDLCEKIKQAQIEMEQALSPDEVSDLQRQAAALEAQEDAMVAMDNSVLEVEGSSDDFPVNESYQDS